MIQLFRITHIDNLPFILKNGLHCSNSEIKDADFKPIGFKTLIENRNKRSVPIKPFGNLSDYIPFYFWYRMPMLFVIHKKNDPEVYLTNNKDIIYLVSNFEKLNENNCNFIFTDRHAQLEYANFYNSLDDLNKLNWKAIKTNEWARQFGIDIMEMKQAECLIYKHLPIQAIYGIAVYNNDIKLKIEETLTNLNLPISVKVKPDFYFNI